MRILVFGDSIVQGAFDTECGGWPHRLAAYSYQKSLTDAESVDVDVLSLGIGGDCTKRLLNRFESETKTRLNAKEGAIIIAIGVNDTQRYVVDNHIKTEPSAFKQNIKLLINIARKYTQSIYFVGLLPIVESMLQPMPWANDRGHFAEDVEVYNQLLKEVCDSEVVGYVPMNEVFGAESKKYLVDGIHPNTEGHKLIFERVKQVLEKENII